MEKLQPDERRVCDDATSTVETVTLLVSFGLGFLTGAAMTLLSTPESGMRVRVRLRRGLKTAKQELEGIVGDTGEAWNKVSSDTREALKRTVIKVKQAAQVTKKALAECKSEDRKTL